MTDIETRIKGIWDMKTLIALAVLATAVAAPAFAQTSERFGHAERYGNAVVSGNKVLGTDPDQNVRFDLLREQNWRNGGY
jgi:hypothetical protein